MKISYDPEVDALYIRLIEEEAECEVIRLNESISLNIGTRERIVGIEILDAGDMLTDIKDKKIHLENLTAA